MSEGLWHEAIGGKIVVGRSQGEGFAGRLIERLFLVHHAGAVCRYEEWQFRDAEHSGAAKAAKKPRARRCF